MITNSYYSVRPFLPRWLQIKGRRFRVARTPSTDAWPVWENCGARPVLFQGWPEHKRFAVVLTHDVESSFGVSRCERLAEMEEHRGLRSCFGFVPRRYDTPEGLRRRLASSGFEITVHGLYHDGKEFRSRRHFEERRPQIISFLSRWESRGFASPSSLHNLAWISELDIDYDISTFDVDPFEPQSCQLGRIFPFWVQRRDGREGFVELPYTLPQDFTLFVLLQEKTDALWRTKLDWIAEKGGMALIKTHPDYMAFDPSEKRIDTYPVELYTDFLDYLQERYRDQFWLAQPSEVARFWRSLPPVDPVDNILPYRDTFCKLCKQAHKDGYLTNYRPADGEAVRRAASRPRKRACMVAYTFYEADNRVRRYAEALVKRGEHVDAIALRREGEPAYDVIRGVHVHRIQERRIDETGPLSYLRKLVAFLFRSAWFLTRRHMRDAYDLIHVHSVPDFEVFAALIPRVMGARVILDIHDIVPEFYASKFNVGEHSLFFRLLVLVENLSAAFADHVIIANHLWYRKLTHRSVPPEKCTPLTNYPDTSIFHPKPSSGEPKHEFVMSYPGTLMRHQGVDLAVLALAKLRDAAPNLRFLIVGDGAGRESIRALIREQHLEDRVTLKGLVPTEKVAEILADVDLGVVPKRKDSFGNEAFSTKIPEFMAMGIPVVASRTRIDEYYFNEDIIQFFESGNVDDLAAKILDLMTNSDRRASQVSRAKEFVGQNNWDARKQEYLDLVDRLVNPVVSSETETVFNRTGTR
ncbi:MAG: glycosyltransferase [Bryobacteraceae bacterium]